MKSRPVAITFHELHRSAAVPGRSDVKPTTAFESTRRLETLNVAAPEDGRAPVQAHHARTVSGKSFPGLAVAVCLAGLFGGCYSFSGAREEIRQNQEQEANINREIQKEQDRERELENSTNFPATNGPSK